MTKRVHAAHYGQLPTQVNTECKHLPTNEWESLLAGELDGLSRADLARVLGYVEGIRTRDPVT